MSTCNIYLQYVDTNQKFKSQINIIILNVNITTLHVDIIYLACMGQKYATIAKFKYSSSSNEINLLNKKFY